MRHYLATIFYSMPTQRDCRLPFIYAAAIFVSAFLLFQIQPLISKRILPWFGGSPAVWTTCLLFFQTVLFAGYAYAHSSNKWLKPRQQALVHAALIVLALILMHAVPSESWEPTGTESPVPRILLILAVSIGLPYFVLSATGPLLQAWFARAFPGRVPYRLYALSNIGSLLALASYPFFFEPKFNLQGQGLLWAAGFIIYAALCAYIAWRIAVETRVDLFSDLAPSARAVAKKHSPLGKQPLEAVSDQPPRPTAGLYALWLILAAFASVVLIATTNHISTDIAVMPLLWVVPLALYLITFIIAFDRPAWYRRLPIALIAIVSIYATAVTHHLGMGHSFFYDLGTIGLICSFFGDPNAPPPTLYVTTAQVLIANFTALFAICLLCHGEIVRTRPAPRYLTSFYLMISAGGALGGIFATIIAPLIFTSYLEWDGALIVACLASLVIVAWACVSRLTRHREQAARQDQPTRRRYGFLAVAALLLLVVSLDILIDVNELLASGITDIRWSGRSFFGTLTVQEGEPGDDAWNRYDLFHGTTSHGSQYTSKSRNREPTTYFSRQSGVGQAIIYFQKRLAPGRLRLGVVGLGAGTLASYPEAGDSITFYEIDPAVIQLAEAGNWFTYVRDCRSRGANCDIRVGDARLSIQRELNPVLPADSSHGGNADRVKQRPSYHLLVLDAFSGDSVPVHLLTIEAFELYLKALAPTADSNGNPTEGGAIAVHISNRYLNLEPVVRAAALRFKLLYLPFYTKDDPDRNIRTAHWIILTSNAAMADEIRKFATPIQMHGRPVLWTDERSSLFEVLR
jgi:hypothetical protein